MRETDYLNKTIMAAKQSWRFLGNFYVLSTLAFVFWMLFFDGNDLMNQYKLKQERAELVSQKEFYESEIGKIKLETKALKQSPYLLERIAREKYLMRREGEDIYIVPSENFQAKSNTNNQNP
ncbi:MAG: septum formation initiator family protein [Cytophagales bacterium]|nr:MAG: septum formation initiator family protein [Cytophagales bacterium]TAF61539.1 MAG: septum formation initiator family protein [Cytophagales bacterium]